MRLLFNKAVDDIDQDTANFIAHKLHSGARSLDFTDLVKALESMERTPTDWLTLAELCEIQINVVKKTLQSSN